MTSELKKGIKKRNAAWKKFHEHTTYINEIRYKAARNKVKMDIIRAKKEYEFKLAMRIKDDPKSFYSYIRSKKEVKVRVGPLQDKKGEIVSDNEGMATILNQHFTALGIYSRGHFKP